MEQKIIELANLYDVEISDTPGCKIVENGVERLATKDDADKIFRFNELLEKIEKKISSHLNPIKFPEKILTNGFIRIKMILYLQQEVLSMVY